MRPVASPLSATPRLGLLQHRCSQTSTRLGSRTNVATAHRLRHSACAVNTYKVGIGFRVTGPSQPISELAPPTWSHNWGGTQNSLSFGLDYKKVCC